MEFEIAPLRLQEPPEPAWTNTAGSGALWKKGCGASFGPGVGQEVLEPMEQVIDIPGTGISSPPITRIGAPVETTRIPGIPNDRYAIGPPSPVKYIEL